MKPIITFNMKNQLNKGHAKCQFAMILDQIYTYFALSFPTHSPHVHVYKQYTSNQRISTKF